MANLEQGVRDDWQRFISALIERTQKGTIDWQDAADNDIPELDDDKIVGPCFTTTLNEKRLRLYEIRHEVSDLGAYFSSTALADYLPARSRRPWAKTIVLELAATEGGNWWRFPSMTITRDLFDAVSRQSARVDEFIQSILREDATDGPEVTTTASARKTPPKIGPQ